MTVPFLTVRRKAILKHWFQVWVGGCCSRQTGQRCSLHSKEVGRNGKGALGNSRWSAQEAKGTYSVQH